jgi:peptidoglycan-N-acetylmuramic acid deacetylase
MKNRAAVLFLALVLSTQVTVSAIEGNWGLSYPNRGQSPVGNASSEHLKKFDAYYLGDTSKKIIYLTFDAGYEEGYTAPILDTLKKHEVSATFFLVGHYMKTAPELVKRMIDEGHTIGNHSHGHPDMSSVDSAAFQKELEALETLYKDITGQEIARFYRPPQGKYNDRNLEQAKQLGYKTFFWSLAYADWNKDKQPTREQAFDKLIPRIHPGAIVLLHNTSRTNMEILDELLTKWKADGYTFGRLEDIV